MFIFKKDIERQVERYIEHRGKRGSYQAERDREWITKFCKVTGCNDVFLAPEKVADFKKYLNREYPSDFYVHDALHSIQGLLKFYRCIKWTEVL